MIAKAWREHPRLTWLTVVTLLVVLDQFSKGWFASSIPLNSGVEITPWFNLVHVLNTGAAFSLFADLGGWQRIVLIAVGFMAVIPIGFFCLTGQVEPLERLAGAMLVAGGSGNLIDRIDSGAVIDFLDLHWRGVHWPAFNLADVFIVLAVSLWVLVSWRPSTSTSGSAA